MKKMKIMKIMKKSRHRQIAANHANCCLILPIFYSGTTLFTNLFESPLYLDLFCKIRRSRS